MMRVTVLAVLAWAVVLMGSCLSFMPSGPVLSGEERQYLGMVTR